MLRFCTLLLLSFLLLNIAESAEIQSQWPLNARHSRALEDSENFTRILQRFTEQQSRSPGQDPQQLLTRIVQQELTDARDQRLFWLLVNREKTTPFEDPGSDCPIAVPAFPACPAPSPSSEMERLKNEGDWPMPYLRDIRLAAAMGDSLTAGIFIQAGKAGVFRYLIGLPTEDRGYSFTAGGLSDSLTMPANIRQFSPLMVGYGLTQTKAKALPTDVPFNELNLAVSGSLLDDVWGQLEQFLSRLKTAAYEPYVGQWKSLQLFVKGNNMFSCCIETLRNPETGIHRSDPVYVNNVLNNVLQRLYDELPRDTNGNHNILITVFTIFKKPSTIASVTQGDFWCDKVHEIANLVPCLFGSNQTVLDQIDTLAEQYNNLTISLVREWQQKLRQTNDTRFRVIVNRAMENLDIGDLGKEFINGADCFHPNICFHRLMTYGLWQSMTVGGQGRTRSPYWYRQPITWNTCEEYDASPILELS